MARAPVAAALVVIGLTGCYASTEPATEVGPETARLNAQGSANNGPARSNFQYWLTGSTRPRLATTARNWPANASGPFSEKLIGLAADAEYSFRICGSDQGGSACAQTRTFRTPPAVEDGASGWMWVGCCGRLEFVAHSTAAGANPRGIVSYRNSNGVETTSFTGTVTCLAVNGRRAAIGAVGKVSFQPSGISRDQAWLLTIEDGHLGADEINQVIREETTPPDCAGASFENLGEPIIPEYELIVNDA